MKARLAFYSVRLDPQGRGLRFTVRVDRETTTYNDLLIENVLLRPVTGEEWKTEPAYRTEPDLHLSAAAVARILASVPGIFGIERAKLSTALKGDA